jgi:hypothetical protein
MIHANTPPENAAPDDEEDGIDHHRHYGRDDPASLQSNGAMDAMILELAPAEFEKVAVFMSRVFDPAAALTRPREYDALGPWIADRIYALVDAGRLDVQGNMRRWRDGAIKRKAGA